MKLKVPILALVLMVLPHSAIAGEVIFLGKLFYVRASNCAQQSAGSLYNSMYKLSGLGTNGPDTTIAETFDFGGHAYRRPGGRFTSAFTPVEAHSASFGAHTYSARVKITSSIPPDGSISAATEFVSLTGQFEGPQGDPGVGGNKCIINFTATYVRYDKP